MSDSLMVRQKEEKRYPRKDQKAKRITDCLASPSQAVDGSLGRRPYPPALGGASLPLDVETPAVSCLSAKVGSDSALPLGARGVISLPAQAKIGLGSPSRPERIFGSGSCTLTRAREIVAEEHESSTTGPPVLLTTLCPLPPRRFGLDRSSSLPVPERASMSM